MIYMTATSCVSERSATVVFWMTEEWDFEDFVMLGYRLLMSE